MSIFHNKYIQGVRLKKTFKFLIILILSTNSYVFSQGIEKIYTFSKEITSINFKTTDDIKILTADGTLYKTKDLFANIEQICYEKDLHFDIKFIDEKTWYGLGLENHLLKTTNAGLNWFKIRITNLDFIEHILTNIYN